MSDFPKGHPLQTLLAWIVGLTAILTALEILVDQLLAMLPKLGFVLALLAAILVLLRRWQSKNSW